MCIDLPLQNNMLHYITLHYITFHYITGWWFGTFGLFSQNILGMSSSQLTMTISYNIICFRGVAIPPTSFHECYKPTYNFRVISCYIPKLGYLSGYIYGIWL